MIRSGERHLVRKAEIGKSRPASGSGGRGGAASPKKKRRNSYIHPRASDDFYIEPCWVDERLFQVEHFNPEHVLLDPCTGSGRIADAAKAAGLVVVTADICDRYPGTRIQNFLDRHSAPPSLVGNPPFNVVEAFARHALAIGGRHVALLFPTARLNAARWLRELPLRRVWLLRPRPSMPPGEVILRGEKAGGGKTDFCWLVFTAGYAGAPELRWLHRDEGGG